MNSAVDNTPHFVLVDDDANSAHLLMRMLLAHGSPRIEAFDSAEDAAARLLPSLAVSRPWPTLVIVDLKDHSAANLEFVAMLAPFVAKLEIPVVVLSQAADRQSTDALLDAGASAVFTRYAELHAYRREAANIVSFWARNQRLDAVGM